jgi:YfiH family protein
MTKMSTSNTFTVPHDWLVPDWPAPANVRACCTTRQGGVSEGPYASFNLGDHVGDTAQAVQANRAMLQQSLQLPAQPLWLQQVHGTTVLSLPHQQDDLQADASVTHEQGCACSVLTADCLPLLFCNRQGTVVAAAHAGWRGLAAGVIEATVARLDSAAEDVLVWLGPAIGPKRFEVGEEVRQAFLAHDPQAAAAFTDEAFTEGNTAEPGRWLADLYVLARQRLQALGVTHIHGGGLCTFTDSRRFYSYRRDHTTGRMASLIWLHSSAE